MKIKINNDILDFKIISGKSNEVNFLFEDEIFAISKEELIKETIIASLNDHQIQIKAYDHVFEVQEINEQRNKDLKIHSPIANHSTQISTQDTHIVAAIMKASQARL
ncbi:MAG: hypothetical protein A2202_07030 [Bdellovibrionales bacterium RIFOXYA1_FULL_36_14]|nr:MAG: hypothetical protein A2202_07030 [Bdellovibrionales bacterium RIFOXYA1_FULL_36_14]